MSVLKVKIEGEWVDIPALKCDNSEAIEYVDKQIGDIGTVLDTIISIQNRFIGGGSV